MNWSAYQWIALLLVLMSSRNALGATPQEILDKLIAQRDSVANFVVDSEWEEYWDGKPTTWEQQTIIWDNLGRRRVIYESGKLDAAGNKIPQAATRGAEAVSKTDFLFDGEILAYQQFLPNVDRQGLSDTGLPLGYHRAIISDAATSARGEIESHRNPVEYLRNTLIWDLQKRIEDKREITVRETDPSVYELEYAPLSDAGPTEVVRSVAVVDGARGWSATRLASYGKSDRLVAEYVFEVQADGEHWIPVAGSHRHWGDRSPETPPIFDWRFKVQKFRVNDPAFSEDVFRLALPPDTAVSDTRFNVAYRIGASEAAVAELTRFAQDALEEERANVKPAARVPPASSRRTMIVVANAALLGILVIGAVLRRRRQVGLPLALIALLTMTGSATADPGFSLPENPYALDSDKCCGPYCLLFLDSYFSGKCRIDQVLSDCPPGTMGTSLAQLQKAASALGYHTAPFKYADIEQLRQLRFPAIIHLTKENHAGHFIVVLGPGKTGTIRGFSPPSDYGIFDSDDLRKGISGIGLVVSPDPLPPLDELTWQDRTWTAWLGNPMLMAVLSVVVIAQFINVKSLKSQVPVPHVRQPVLLLIMALPLASCTSQSGIPMAVNADMSVPVPNEFEVKLGKVQEGSVIEHNFRLVNTSNQPLRITDIKKSCSCQAVFTDRETPIPPGETRLVGMKFQTKGVEGPIQQKIIVMTDSSSERLREIPMSVHVDVDGGFKVVPSQVMVGKIESEKPVERTLQVRLTRSELANLSVTAEAENNPFLTVVPSHRVPGVASFDLRLDPSMPPGPIFGQVRVRVGRADMKDVIVPIVGTRLGSITVLPRLLAMKANEGYPQQRTLRVSTPTDPFRVVRIEAPDGITVRGVQQDRPAPSFELEVSVERPPERTNPFLTIHFDRRDQSKMCIPIVFDS